jgi:DNA-binding transcriptional MerR regulator
MRIGRVAELADISVDAIRCYERQGLLRRPSRSVSGYRDYADVVVERLRFIREAKTWGFVLREIKELLALRIDSQTCDLLMSRAEAKLTDIDTRIRHLQTVRRALKRGMQACKDRNPTNDCLAVGALQRAKRAG